MSVYIQKNLSSKKPIVLEDIADYKIQDLNDQAHFQAFLFKSNRLMNIYIQKIKVIYQFQLILKITVYSNPTDQEQLGALILKRVRQVSGSKNDLQHAFNLLAPFLLCCPQRVTFPLFTPQQYKVKISESVRLCMKRCRHFRMHLKLKLVILSSHALNLRIMHLSYMF